MKYLNKFLIAIIAGLLIYISASLYIVLIRFESLYVNTGKTLDNIAISLISNLFFFLLVGFVAIIAQFYGDRGDVLRERLRRMFASQSISYPVLEYFESVVRENGVFAELAEHEIIILEYNEELQAYRGAFHNRYKLRNAFGDVPYDAELSVEIAPDMIAESLKPCAFISELKIVFPNGKSIDFLGGPRNIGAKGFKQPIRITLSPNGSATFEMAWWSWIEVGGESGFSQKRFSERFVVKIGNRSSVTPRIETNDESEPNNIAYGQEYVVADLPAMPPKERLGFWWRAPAEFPAHDKPRSKRSALSEGILQFDRKYGEPIERKF